MEKPSEEQWNAGIRVLRYLKTTAANYIMYQGQKNWTQTSAYSDADWASNKNCRKLMSGTMVMINESPVIFKSKYQQSVALSTAEAEYMTLSLCVQEVLWRNNLLTEMKVQVRFPVRIYEDNQSTIALANNDGDQSRAKHIDIRHHFVRQHVKLNNITLEYIESRKQLADFLTNPLSARQFQDLVTKSNIGKCMSRGSVVQTESSTITANQSEAE